MTNPNRPRQRPATRPAGQNPPPARTETVQPASVELQAQPLDPTPSDAPRIDPTPSASPASTETEPTDSHDHVMAEVCPTCTANAALAGPVVVHEFTRGPDMDPVTGDMVTRTVQVPVSVELDVVVLAASVVDQLFTDAGWTRTS